VGNEQLKNNAKETQEAENRLRFLGHRSYNKETAKGAQRKKNHTAKRKKEERSKPERLHKKIDITTWPMVGPDFGEKRGKA